MIIFILKNIFYNCKGKSIENIKLTCLNFVWLKAKKNHKCYKIIFKIYLSILIIKNQF